MSPRCSAARASASSPRRCEQGAVGARHPGARAPPAAAQLLRQAERLGARAEGAPGLGYIVFEGGEAKGPIAKFLDARRASRRSSSAAGVRRRRRAVLRLRQAAKAAGSSPARRAPHRRGTRPVEKNAFQFCWIVDFPMYELNEDTGKIDFSHNPFSMPQGGLEALETKDPLTIKAFQYDIVCNGVELSSGAIRNHLPEIMYKAFEIAGYRPGARSKAASAACSMRSSSARRPMAARRRASTASSCCWPTSPISARSSLFPMNQQAQDLLMRRRAEVAARAAARSCISGSICRRQVERSPGLTGDQRRSPATSNIAPVT